MEGELTLAKNILIEQLEALGSFQVESLLRVKLLCFAPSLFLLSNSSIGVLAWNTLFRASKKAENVTKYITLEEK